ncbi:MAG: hypothetical protein HXY18_00730 [Bryobacteraceae bacterium]|nr:hypothetical protein [Bryobacteraceae bacterium]
MSKRTGFIAIAVFAACGAAQAATTPEVETAGSLPEAVKARGVRCSDGGVKLKGPGGATVEIWVRDTLPNGEKPESPDVAFMKIPHGAMIGFIRVTGKFTDRRG